MQETKEDQLELQSYFNILLQEELGKQVMLKVSFKLNLLKTKVYGVNIMIN